MRLIIVGVVLAVFGAVFGLALAMSHQSDASLAGGQRLDSPVQMYATVPPGQQACYPCPPIGTEGPPERHLPGSVTSAEPADRAPVYCP
ncbi:MAG: hypothetical protein AAB254_05910, partial [candidate division NC10 bacterium]